ncbi:uncharacterized protein At5g41620 [Eucalyptus grandis]|uniref:uncharacterized protein At5g41620 n=1 Tax=Eucalyptus grandis TaxID=71139 RepID=UPI00052579B5|nr:uncharacterized protein At5g41620 [Eucalyptus grandis]
MESRGKSVEREGKEQGLVLKKWKQGVALGKRGGPSTPPPTWRLELSPSQPQTHSIQEFLTPLPHPSALSARKLCACLWEIEPHQTVHFARMMSKSKSRHRQHKHHHDLGFEDFVLPSTVKPEEPATAGCLTEQIAASPIQRHNYGGTDHAFESATPETCSGSMEVAPYKPPPRGSFDGKGRVGGSGYSLQTSTELLKVLNRIWSLEEQHVSDKSMLKALKSELHQSHSRIKELVWEKQKDSRIMDDLMKELAEDKYDRKQMEQERIAEAELLREETEKERKLRKRSESLHRKLAKELSELKSPYSTALRELEREKKARVLLENLCDEFAKGIRDYEQVVRSLKHGPIKESVVRESLDRLILHISEAWLDERLQMKLAESHDDVAGKDTVVDKLSSDIESFLQTKRSAESSKNGEISWNDTKERCFRRPSLESFALKDGGSAPPVAHDDDRSFDSDLQCFEQSNKVDAQENKDSCKRNGANASHGHLDDLVRSRSSDKDMRRCEIAKSCNPSTPPEACINGGTGENVKMGEENRSGPNNMETFEMGTNAGDCQQGEHRGSDANGSFDHMIRSHSLRLKSARTRPASNSRDGHRGLPGYTGQISPVQKWPSKVPLREPGKITSSLRWPKGLKENTLMAKLLEARIEGQHSRSKAHRDAA